jgi:hypothetical protein
LVLAIIGSGLLVFGVLLTLPYVGSLSGVSYGYFPVTHLGGLGIMLIVMGLISAILSIAMRDTARNQTDDNRDVPRFAHPLRNFPSITERFNHVSPAGQQER